MAEEIPPVSIRAIAGLWNSPNPFSRVPEGALDIADEVVLRANGALESRRGFDPVSVPGARVFPMGAQYVAVVGPAVLPVDMSTKHGFGLINTLSGTPAVTAPYSTDPRVNIGATGANQTIITTSQNGPQTTPYPLSLNGIPALIERHISGLPRCPAPQITLIAAVGNALMSANSRRTYRVTIAWYDSRGNFFESEPSEQVWVETGGSTQTPQIVLRWPLAMHFPLFDQHGPWAAFFRIWRGVETAVGVPTNDEMFLTREFVPAFASYGFGNNNGFIDTNGTYTINDVSIDSLLNVPLYTNPQTGDGNGILGSNTRPPVSTAVAYFKGRMYYGRCTYQQNLSLQIIGTGTGGIAPGDTILIDGITYTAGGAGLEASGIFNCPTGAGVVAQNIETTAKSLIECIRQAYCTTGGAGYARQINRQLYAYYASSDVTDFGRIVISRPLPISTSDDPAIGFSATTTSNGVRFPNGSAFSMDNYSPGGLSWAKPNQPEAVPGINFNVIGDENRALLGFSVHRDCLIIYKEDGAFICRDDGGIAGPSFDLLDTSAICIAPASIAVVSNMAYVLCTRGVLQLSEQGTEMMSGPIFEELDKLYRQNANALAIAYGFAHESERLYVLGVPSSASEPACSYQYVLRIPESSNVLPVWSRWLLPGTLHGCVATLTNQIAFVTSSLILAERRGNVVSLDYFDNYLALSGLTAPGASAAIVVLTGDRRTTIGTGDLLVYNPAGVGGKIYQPRVIAVAYNSTSNQTTLTLDSTVPWAGGTFNTLPSIRCRWRFAPITGGAPTEEKQWGAVQAYFKYLDGDWVDFRLDSEETPLSSFSQVYNDPRNDNFGGQIKLSFPGDVLPDPVPHAAVGAIQWWRNCADVVLRVDPAGVEARGLRLGLEMQHAQAQSSFKLVAISATVKEVTDVGGR